MFADDIGAVDQEFLTELRKEELVRTEADPWLFELALAPREFIKGVV